MGGRCRPQLQSIDQAVPIRRRLDVGQESKVRAAELRFPSFTFDPLEQLYRRIATAAYRYEIAGGTLVAGLRANYRRFWQIKAFV